MSAFRPVMLLPWLLLAAGAFAQTDGGQNDGQNGAQIMQQVQTRHLLGTSIYEEITLILTDRLGSRDTRTLRRYMRTDPAGNTDLLLVFDTPVDVAGAALLARRDVSGAITQQLYLPASGSAELLPLEPVPDGKLFGTDFSLEQMIGETLAQYQYVLAGQQRLGRVNHHLIDVYARDANIGSSPPLRRHYVRQDSYTISRTDYLDPRGRLLAQKTLHDLRQTGDQSWRAGMVLMTDFGERHHSLLKINRAIFSDGFAPAEVFRPEWLYRNHPPRVLSVTVDSTHGETLIIPAAGDASGQGPATMEGR